MVKKINKGTLISIIILLFAFGIMLFDFALGSVLGIPAFAYLLIHPKLHNISEKRKGEKNG